MSQTKIFPGIREIREIRGQIRSFFHPGTGPGAAGQVVIDNCRSTEHHACGSPKERSEEERANPNDCQQEVLSRKIGASRKHRKVRQLQQIITAVRHRGKTKAVNFSRFIFITFFVTIQVEGKVPPAGPTGAGGTPALPGLFFGQFGSTKVVLRILKMDSGVFPGLQNEGQNPRGILSQTNLVGASAIDMAGNGAIVVGMPACFQTVVIAIGGNSLIKDAQHMSVPDQYVAVMAAARHIAGLIERGYRIVITHGNGPQVGFILLRSEHSRGLLHQVPLDSIVADTQGALGYQIQQALENEFRRRGLKNSVATVITQTLVDRHDPAFVKPGKPIGEFYTREQAEDRMRVEKWAMVEDAGRGWRRVVASPKPARIIEAGVIKHLVKDGYVVIAAGGGGIPVVADEQGMLSGVAAVIDKDLASAVLAAEIGADLLVISTAVERVCLNFGKPNQRSLDSMTLAEARQYIHEGHFAPGSMLPKVQACIGFIEQGGREALITCPEALSVALEGRSGTRVVL